MHLPMPEPAPVTSAILPLRRMRPVPFGRHAVGLRPAEAVRPPARPRLIFATDKARIAEPVHRREYRGIIQFAFVGLRRRRYRGNLRVTDQRKKFLETLDEIAADDLDVIKIE